ncbi:MAG: hypothetical protein ACE5FI_08145 [Anaerolineales bacterium]
MKRMSEPPTEHTTQQGVPPSHRDYSSFQEGTRRLADAMQGVPDRVPVYAQLHEFALRQLGISARDFYSNADLRLKTQP